MSDRRAARLRLLIAVLLLSNLGLLLYMLLTPEPRSQTAARIEALQINPGRIKVLGAASRGPAMGSVSATAEKGGTSRACLEWGPIAAGDVAKVDAALGRIGLLKPPVQQPITDAGGAKRYVYFLREPDSKIVAEVAELQRSFPGTEIRAAACP
ncbi:MAG TPA: hypothetical protein VFB75_20855 [Burkholderiales bacterium]|nr:hypothetical protein [Burkholderiales bacterium]